MFVVNQNVYYLDRIFKKIYIILNVMNVLIVVFFVMLGKC